jgi:hypothetical protein
MTENGNTKKENTPHPLSLSTLCRGMALNGNTKRRFFHFNCRIKVSNAVAGGD